MIEVHCECDCTTVEKFILDVKRRRIIIFFNCGHGIIMLTSMSFLTDVEAFKKLFPEINLHVVKVKEET